MFLHRDVKIEVDAKGNFVGKVGEDSITAISLTAAQAEVDKLLLEQAKARKIGLRVVGVLTKNTSYYARESDNPPKIHHALLVGIHRNTGDLQFTGVPKDHSLKFVLPDIPECESFIQQYMDKEKEWRRFEDRMKNFSINGKFGRTPAENYNTLIDEKEKQYRKAIYAFTIG